MGRTYPIQTSHFCFHLAVFKETTNSHLLEGATLSCCWESSYLGKQGSHFCHSQTNLFRARQEAAGEGHEVQQ